MKTIDVRTSPETEMVQVPRKTFLIPSMILLAIVCAISAFFYIENIRLNSSIKVNGDKSVDYTASIEKLKNDSRIKRADTVTANKDDIMASVRLSEAQRYIAEMINISRKYKIGFNGFSYQNGKISTTATALADATVASDDGVKKVTNFIRDYRTMTGSLFILDPVTSVSGYEQKRDFPVGFTVK